MTTSTMTKARMSMPMVMVTMWFSLGAQSGTLSNSRPGGFCLSGSELWVGIRMMMAAVILDVYHDFNDIILK